MMIFEGYPGGTRAKGTQAVRVKGLSVGSSKQVTDHQLLKANSKKLIPDWQTANYRLEDWK